ncbi:hypothetical protein D3C72_2265170 [compost metagenome]
MGTMRMKRRRRKPTAEKRPSPVTTTMMKPEMTKNRMTPSQPSRPKARSRSSSG